VVLLDEPTTGLDPILTNAVYSMIVDFQKKLGFTAVMISHEIPVWTKSSSYCIMPTSTLPGRLLPGWPEN
jgi:ABC-type transporter Mla maintaining outer membrane lipid asymmetry ATPase subunit MlaF